MVFLIGCRRFDANTGRVGAQCSPYASRNMASGLPLPKVRPSGTNIRSMSPFAAAFTYSAVRADSTLMSTMVPSIRIRRPLVGPVLSTTRSQAPCEATCRMTPGTILPPVLLSG